ncbi:MAG: FAD:protein FMN transferase [Planctomycetota bacterium]
MIVRTAIFAMGTRFELVLEGRSSSHAEAAGEAAMEVVAEWDARLSRFRSDSLVSRINREAGAAWVRVDSETFDLLDRCLRWRVETAEAFDICVGKSMDRLRASSAALSPGESAVGACELDRASSSLRFTRADTALDLGAIGKGFALDRAAEVLREAGIECALLHGGTSSVIALGAPPTSPEGWRVDLGPELEHATVVLRDRALSVSAARGSRGLRSQGAAKGHIVDPHDGTLLTTDARCAVCAPSATQAEVWSTAMLVLRARRGGGTAQSPAVVVPDDVDCTVRDGTGAIHRPRARAIPRGARAPERPPVVRGRADMNQPRDPWLVAPASEKSEQAFPGPGQVKEVVFDGNP